MTLEKVSELLEAKVWTQDETLDNEVYAACGCDLMSDVLAFAKEKMLLLTGLINLQVIRTAELLDIKAIVFVRGKVPTEEMIELANRMQITLFSTDAHLFIACGKLYAAGLGKESMRVR